MAFCFLEAFIVRCVSEGDFYWGLLSDDVWFASEHITQVQLKYNL